MIELNLKLQNPWWGERWANVWYAAGDTLLKNKFWELQLMKSSVLLGISLGITHRCDHAGIRVNIALFGYELDANLYDNRHWNYEENRWYVYNEENGLH